MVLWTCCGGMIVSSDVSSVPSAKNQIRISCALNRVAFLVVPFKGVMTEMSI